MVLRAKKALVVAAHPDDELLGFGGTLARLVQAGTVVDILILATGALSRADAGSGEVNALMDQARLAAARIGARPPRFAGFPDNAMDGLPLLTVVQAVEAVVDELRPDLVFTHHAGDLNIDHRIAHEAVLTACRPLAGQPVRTILAGETMSSTEWQSVASSAFLPTVFVDVSATLDVKLAALSAYVGEMRPHPHPRSLEQVTDQAKVWGRKVGCAAAEAFMLVRHVVD